MSGRILIVDDNETNIKLMSAKLASEYFDIITANNGLQALEKAEKEAPDVILLDIMMPEIDGFEVCRRLRSNPTTMHIPIIMVTALSETSHRVRGLEVGADDFLSRPVSDIALIARIKSLIRLKMIIDEWRLRENTSNQFGLSSEPQNPLLESYLYANVLLLSDKVVDQDKIKSVLEPDHSELVLAQNGQKLIELVNQKKPDLIICDLHVGQEDILRLLAYLRGQESARHIPILVMAEEHDLDRISKALEIGVNDYILRPIDRNELLARCRTQIRRRRYQERLKANYEQSLTLALTDGLTETFNRRYVNVHLPKLLARSIEQNKTLAVMFCDVDRFKNINDVYGHTVGDEVLKELGSRITANLRSFDLAARIGGEEFLIVMLDTGLDIALTVADRLRHIVADQPFKVSGPVNQIPVTISIGVTISRSDDSMETLLKRSDEAMYKAKKEGRNRVIVADMPD